MRSFGAPIAISGLVATVGLILSGVAIRRYRLHWPSVKAARADRKQQAFNQKFNIRIISWYALLIAIGSVLALCVVPFDSMKTAFDLLDLDYEAVKLYVEDMVDDLVMTARLSSLS